MDQWWSRRSAIGICSDNLVQDGPGGHLCQSVEQTSVPQLLIIAELELNVTRVSLQLRHAMLARNPAELSQTLADVSEKKALLEARLSELGKNMTETEGQRVYAPLPELMKQFWEIGRQNVELINAGKKDEAFAFLVDKTIPARNRLLSPLAAEKKRQGEVLASKIHSIKELAGTNRNLVVSVMVLVAAALLGLWAYLRNVVRRLGADPVELREIAREVAQGNLAVEIDLRRNDTTSIMAALSLMAGRLGETVLSVRRNAESVATASAQISHGNQDLSARTEQQASALQQTSTSMEHLSATVSHNAQHARDANNLATTATEIAKQGGSVVAQVVDTMRGINESSRKISDIIGVIDGIAFQTNILALNAAVEAARAGEQGRGFAVVAAEVRSLAQRCAQAAKEIKELIDTSVDRVGQGTDLVAKAGSTMADVVNAIGNVAATVSEISAASADQSQAVVQVSAAVSQMDQTTQHNAALVEEISAAAASLSTQAKDLVQAVSVFQLPQARK